MAKKHLTEQFIKVLTPQGKRIEYYDQHLIDPESDRIIERGVKGLLIRLTKAGNVYFYYSYWFDGTSKKYKIGSYPNINVHEARDKARDLSLLVNDGIDPLEEKKERLNDTKQITFLELSELYKKRHFPKLRESTIKGYRNRIDNKILPEFGSTYIKQLERIDVVRFLERIAFDEGNPTSANRIRNILSSICSFGVQRGLIEYNPISGIKPVAKEKSRRRVYDESEIKALWKAFEKQEPIIQAVLKLLLICGQRKGETLKMKWSDINDGVWTIPGENAKNGRTHYVPLPKLALQILDDLKSITGDSEYVFSSNRREGPVKWLGDLAKRIRKLSGVEDFRLHDLRRTFASQMAKLGVRRTILGKLLNHKGLAGDSSVTAIYDRYEYMDEKREAMISWAGLLKEIL